jgi:hypothetical protein
MYAYNSGLPNVPGMLSHKDSWVYVSFTLCAKLLCTSEANHLQLLHVSIFIKCVAKD